MAAEEPPSLLGLVFIPAGVGSVIWVSFHSAAL